MGAKRGSKKWILMNPGPVNATTRVRKSLLGKDICHREEEYFALQDEVRARLVEVFGVHSTHTAGLIAGSGTAGVEAMLTSFDGQGKTILVLSNGVYGERMRDILKRHGIAHRMLDSAPCEFPSLKQIEAVLKKDKKIAAVAMVHHETSTGMLNPLNAVAGLARRHGKPLLVDAVSSLGAEIIDCAKSGEVYLAGTSGKCLHAFPGIAFVLIPKKGVNRLKVQTSSLYLDLRVAVKKQEARDTPFTPAVQLLYAMREALKELQAQGIKKRITEYARRSRLIQSGVRRLGCRPLLKIKDQSHVLHAFYLPPGISYEVLHAGLRSAGVIIYAGQSKLRSQIFRVANLGLMTKGDIRVFLRALGGVIRADRLRKRPLPVILAAGVGKRFGGKPGGLPKCLVPLGSAKQPLLARYFDAFRRAGIREAVIVVGYAAEKIKKAVRKCAGGIRVRYVMNEQYRRGSVLSLAKAKAYLNRDVVVMDADVFFEAPLLGRLLEAPTKSTFLADPASVSKGEEMMLQSRGKCLKLISKKLNPGFKCEAEATGIVRFSAKDVRKLKWILDVFVREDNLDCEYEDSFTQLMKNTDLAWVSTEGHFWTEMDFKQDHRRIERYLSATQHLSR